MAVVGMGISDGCWKLILGWVRHTTPSDPISDQYFAQLQHLHDAGIRFFPLFAVPPFDHAPVFTGQTAQSMHHVRGNITTYNAHVASRLATFERAHSGVKGEIFNTTESFYTALKKPSAYNATDANCTNSEGTHDLFVV